MYADVSSESQLTAYMYSQHKNQKVYSSKKIKPQFKSNLTLIHAHTTTVRIRT